MRILFLDDDEDRHNAFRKRAGKLDEIVYVWNVAEAKAALTDGDPFDYVYLDHDLDDFGPADMYGWREEYTGQHVAREIAKLPKEKRPDVAVVHSWNPPGAQAMADILREADVYTMLLPFTFEGG